MRGRKPKPLQYKYLHGSVEPHNPAEPEAEGNLTSACCPVHFTAAQREVWEMAVKNAPAGLLKKIDAGALEIWVVAYCLHRAAMLALQKAYERGGLLYQNGPQTVPSPYIGIIARQAAIMLKAGAEMGFTPVSRPRVNVTPVANKQASSDLRAGEAPMQSIDQYLAAAPKPTVN